MSISKPKKREKKFAGFTTLFQTPKPEPKTELEPKKPFTGFSEFYKKIREQDVLDVHGSDINSYEFYEQPIEEENIAKNQESEEPVPVHFRPEGYYKWCEKQTLEALNRCIQEYGDMPQDDENEPIPFQESYPKQRNINDRERKLQRITRLKYDNFRKIFDRSVEDISSEKEDLNPWFHHMLSNLREERNEICSEEPVKLIQSENTLETFYKSLTTDKPMKLCDHKQLRNLNTYPTEFQFKSVNDRLEKYLSITSKKKIKQAESETEKTTIKPLGIPDLDRNTVLAAERRDLVEYINDKVKPVREINFHPEDFKSWYAKMALSQNRKFMKQPRESINHEHETFETWLNRFKENLNKKYNNPFDKEKYDMKSISKLTKEELKGLDFVSVSDGLTTKNPSVSHFSSCRSKIF